MIRYIHEAIINLLSSKLRSFLAVLGVLVGTASVVALISSSELATAHAIAQFKKLGTNMLAIYLQDQDQGQGASGAEARHFRLADVPLLKKTSPQIQLIAPYILSYQSMYFNGASLDGQIIGVTDSFSEIAKLRLTQGRFVSFLDGRAFYCVVGESIAKKISGLGKSPLYNQIQVGNVMFTVIGVLAHWPENLFISADVNQSIIVPLEVAYFLDKHAVIDNILVRLVKNPDLTATQDKLNTTLSTLLPQTKVTFNSPKQLIALIAKQQETFNELLIAIGSISLVVGGIGVMNIMLVSVVERRKEIGIRMAIGARQLDILRMFLIESVTLTLFGGILGVGVGVLSSYFFTVVAGWTFYVYSTPIFLGFAVSVLVGIVSGFYPAWSASKLDPIETLTQ